MSTHEVTAGASLRDAVPASFWLDTPSRPAATDPLAGKQEADLVVVGGGFTGLWTAVLAAQRDPSRRVVLVDADRVAGAATGRNGGFCAASLTHGEANGRSRFPAEYDRLEAAGRTNLDEIERTVTAAGIDCGFERTGELVVATEPYQVAELTDGPLAAGDVRFDRDAMQAEIASPTYLAGLWHQDDCALVDPARLAWGLLQLAAAAGVVVAEHTSVTRMSGARHGVTLTTDGGSTLQARQVALASNAYQPLLRRLRWHTVPVYDYVLVTEPLRPEQLASIGWNRRQGLADSANRFHYYRLTADNRILWGGYDAIYHYGRHVRAGYDQRPATYQLLAEQFFATFPQLEGLRFTHRWGGAIDTCTRFFAFYGTARHGRVSYALGHTGLGVGASRFSANVMLDLLSGESTSRTRLRSVQRRPLPFPPEPFAFLGVEATRAALASADRHQGRRGPWLRLLDRCGLGFDS